MDEPTVRTAIEVGAGIGGVLASAAGWLARREVKRHDDDMTALQQKIEKLPEKFVDKETFDRVAEDIKELLRDHADQSSRTLARIEARIDSLYNNGHK